MKKILFLLLFLSGCASQAEHQCRHQAFGVSHSLLTILSRIESREDLLLQERRLKNVFVQMADVMVQAERLGGVTSDPHLGRLLHAEFIRVNAISGGRELLMAYQQDALWRLQALPDPNRVHLA